MTDPEAMPVSDEDQVFEYRGAQDEMLTHFSCFSGIGGLDLAAEWAGFHTIGQVEYANYPFRVLRQRFGRMPRWRDIRNVTEDALRLAGVARPTVLSGGFPCQPFSTAGKRRGVKDDRYLWPEMLRVVRLLRPTWIVGENVAGFVSMALDDVLTDLERAGYSCRAFVVPAAGVGAPHMRDRVFVVANATGIRREWSPERERGGATEEGGVQKPISRGAYVAHSMSSVCGNVVAHKDEGGRIGARLSVSGGRSDETRTDARRGGADEAHTDLPRPQGRVGGGVPKRPGKRVARSRGALSDPSRELLDWCGTTGNRRTEPANGRWWDSEPPVGRVADGVPSRVDRLRALGNAVVPQQAFPIFQAIAAIEMGVVV